MGMWACPVDVARAGDRLAPRGRCLRLLRSRGPHRRPCCRRGRVARGELVLLPTDTVYGIGADAFTPAAVTGLLAAKNRGRTMPVPVLIGEASTLGGLVVNMPSVAHELAQAFWPGGLTLVLEHAPSLAWDLGDAEGTVA